MQLFNVNNEWYKIGQGANFFFWENWPTKEIASQVNNFNISSCWHYAFDVKINKAEGLKILKYFYRFRLRFLVFIFL